MGHDIRPPGLGLSRVWCVCEIKRRENAGEDAHRCRSRRQAEQMFLPLNTVMSLALSQKMQAG